MKLLFLFVDVFDATETGVVTRSERFRVMAGRRAVAQAIVVVAKKGSSRCDVKEHEFAYSCLGEGAGSGHAEFLEFDLRNGCFGARGIRVRVLEELSIVGRVIVVAANFPDVSRHVVESVFIGREGTHGCRVQVAVLGSVLGRKLSLETIRHPFAVWF